MTPELQALGRRLVGSWRTEASHVQLPGAAIVGTSEVDWFGAGFLVHRTHFEHADIPDALAVLGEQMHYFDVRGVQRLFDLSVTGDGWAVSREQHGDDFAQRMTYEFIADDEMRGRSELSHDGGTWEPDLDISYHRVGTS